MDDFFVIQVTSKAGKDGYIYDAPTGICVLYGFDTRVTKFASWTEAKAFSKQHRLATKGVKVSFVPSNQLMKDVGKPSPYQSVYLITNLRNQFLFFDSKTELYFFNLEGKQAGACAWYTQTEVTDAINKLKPFFADETLMPFTL